MTMLLQSNILIFPACLVVLYLGYAMAGLDRVCTAETRRYGPARGSVCGAKLAQLVADICYPYGYNGSGKKRSIEGPVSRLNMDEVLLEKRDALSYLGKRVVYEKGITCECCYHKCRFRELQQYCRSPNIYAKKSVDI